MHKLGLALTVIFAVVGFWDGRAIDSIPLFQDETMRYFIMPALGMAVFALAMTWGLDRS